MFRFVFALSLQAAEKGSGRTDMLMFESRQWDEVVDE
jgi:hypothetical protein